MLAGILAGIMLAFKVAGFAWEGNDSSYALLARFDNVGGLKVRSPVKIGGVVVGRVADISIDSKTFAPIVTLQVDNKYNQLASTTTASILTSGLLGEQYVGIVPGADEKNLAQGDRIGTTQSAVILENLISQFLYSKAAEPASGAAQ